MADDTPNPGAIDEQCMLDMINFGHGRGAGCQRSECRCRCHSDRGFDCGDPAATERTMTSPVDYYVIVRWIRKSAFHIRDQDRDNHTLCGRRIPTLSPDRITVNETGGTLAVLRKSMDSGRPSCGLCRRVLAARSRA